METQDLSQTTSCYESYDVAVANDLHNKHEGGQQEEHPENRTVQYEEDPERHIQFVYPEEHLKNISRLKQWHWC